MIVEFKIKNFQCIKDELTFSMVSNSKNEFAFKSGHKGVEYLLPTAGIFGANASGKSTIAEAFDFFQDMVMLSYRNDKEDSIEVSPFLLSTKTAEQPTELEITFIQNDILYTYGISIDVNRVWSEWMTIIPKEGRTNEVFSRNYDAEKSEYVWEINDKLIKGAKASLRKLTHQNRLFLSMVAQFKEEQVEDNGKEIIEGAYEWFGGKIRVLRNGQEIAENFSAEKLFNNDPMCETAIALLKSFDVNVSRVTSTKREIPVEILRDLPENQRERFKKRHGYKITMYHLNEQGEEIGLDYHEVSYGTQKLFGIIFPILEVLRSGRVFIADELHCNFHPHLMEKIIQLFQDKKFNKKHAQLIFTSHDVTVMNPTILSTEQIWFTEMRQGQGTHLTPLSSFKPKNDGSYWQNYLAGRFGGIPNIKNVDL